MGQYSEGFLTVPDKGKKWRTSEGKYLDHRPGLGMNTMGAAGTAFLNMFRPVKQRAFPDTFREEYDKDGSYVKPDRSGGFYGPGGNPSGSGMGQAQQKPGMGPYQGHSPRQILPAETTTTNAAGVVQTGKNLGGGGTPINMARSFDDLLQGVGQQPFGGSQLPTAMGNPYTATYKQTAGFGEDTPDIGGMNGATYDSEGGRNALNATNLQDMAPFNPGAPLIEGGSERIAQQSTGITSGRLSDALEGVKTQEANREMTPERRQQMASMAFLNGKDSMSGLKARDAVNDVVYAGGQHYGRGALTEDGKIGDKYKIDRADARDIASGKQTAAGLLDVYKSRITESAGSTTPVEAQEPITLEKPGVKQSFSRTETITPGIDTSIPDTTAFNSNNGVDVPGFGKTGGYKSGMKRIDTSMTNPFR